MRAHMSVKCSSARLYGQSKTRQFPLRDGLKRRRAAAFTSATIEDLRADVQKGLDSGRVMIVEGSLHLAWGECLTLCRILDGKVEIIRVRHGSRKITPKIVG